MSLRWDSTGPKLWFVSQISIVRTPRTISRFLDPPLRAGGSHSSWPGISPRLQQPTRKSNGAGRSSSPIWSCSAWGLPCRRPLPEPRCALTAPFHPYPQGKSPVGGIVFCGTFRKTRFKRASPAVSRHVALWRPDFPPAGPSCPGGRAATRPAGPIPLSRH